MTRASIQFTWTDIQAALLTEVPDLAVPRASMSQALQSVRDAVANDHASLRGPSGRLGLTLKNLADELGV